MGVSHRAVVHEATHRLERREPLPANASRVETPPGDSAEGPAVERGDVRFERPPGEFLDVLGRLAEADELLAVDRARGGHRAPPFTNLRDKIHCDIDASG